MKIVKSGMCPVPVFNSWVVAVLSQLPNVISRLRIRGVSDNDLTLVIRGGADDGKLEEGLYRMFRKLLSDRRSSRRAKKKVRSPIKTRLGKKRSKTARRMVAK